MRSEKKTWIEILWATVIFVIIASPMTSKLIVSSLSKLGYYNKPWLVLLASTILFAILLRLVMLLPVFKEPYDPSAPWGYKHGYTGLVNGSDMLNCNGAQLMADKVGCSVCSKAAQACMESPDDDDCSEGRKNCLATCNNKQVASMVNTSCTINQPIPYWPC